MQLVSSSLGFSNSNCCWPSYGPAAGDASGLGMSSAPSQPATVAASCGALMASLPASAPSPATIAGPQASRPTTSTAATQNLLLQDLAQPLPSELQWR